MSSIAPSIPHLDPIEKQILGHLLEKQQKILYVPSYDSGVETLIKRGIVEPFITQTREHLVWQIPMRIPDEIWVILIRHRASLPYKPAVDPTTGKEFEPWRVHDPLLRRRESDRSMHRRL